MSKITNAIGRFASDIKSGDVVHEDPMSGQLTGRLKEALQDYQTPNIVWQAEQVTNPDKGRAKLKARQLTSKGSGSEETEIGADIIFCIEIETPEYSIKKGFLVQAKRLPFYKPMPTSELSILQDQCRKMLDVSAASFVFLYSDRGVHAVPASTVASSKSNNIYELPTYSCETLFFDFAICWYGDPLLQATDLASLSSLCRLTSADEALLVRAKEVAR